jgi:hypothetical protein
MDWLFAAFGAIVATIVGAVMLAVGVWLGFRAVKMTFKMTFWWPNASARIVRYWITRSEDKPNGQRFFHPVVEFETADGRPVVAISAWGSWRRPWPVGRIVSMHYNPTNPRRAEIRCFVNRWQMPLTFVGFTAVLGLVLWFFEFR